MRAESVITFAPVRKLWHTGLILRKKEVVKILPTDHVAKRGAAHLVNGLKARMVEVAIAVATIFALIYCFISYPIRWHLARQHEREVAIPWDKHRMPYQELVACEQTLRDYFKKNEAKLTSFSTPEKREAFFDLCLSQCARSQMVYGPVVRAFVDHLFEKVRKEGQGRKLVFMARDGNSFYKVAERLMEKPEYQAKYPELALKGGLSVGYFTRKIIKEFAQISDDNRKMVQDYMTDELKLDPNGKYLFVDIGLKGSMVPLIRELMPNADIQFNFFLSTSDKADGFLANVENPIESLLEGGANVCIRWLETMHQRNIATPRKLVKNRRGKIYPDTVGPKRTYYDRPYSEPFLLKKFCFKQLVQYATKIDPLKPDEIQKARAVFIETVDAITKGRLSMPIGWDDYFWDGPI